MVSVSAASRGESWNGKCLYGDLDDANRVMFEYHLFNGIWVTVVGLIFITQQNLHKFYGPLARLVNVTIALQLLAMIAYFAQYPYSDRKGNCVEIFLGEFYTVGITFAEFHQLYVIANILGLGRHMFPVFGSLHKMLKYLTIFTVLTSVGCATYFWTEPSMLGHGAMLEEFWTMTAAALQIYCIQLSRQRHYRDRSNDAYEFDSTLVSPTDSDVGLYEKISFCQLIPAAITFTCNVLYIYFGVSFLGDLGSVPMVLDACGNIMFYMKAMIINERSNLVVELVPV